jgi:hypothetical protein
MRRLPFVWLGAILVCGGCGGSHEPAGGAPAPAAGGNGGGGAAPPSTGGSSGIETDAGGGTGGTGGQGGGDQPDADTPPTPAADAAAPALEAGPGSSDPFTIPPGMTALFNGKDLTGWMGSDIWSVNATDMAIVGTTKNKPQNLYTTALYDDFRLVVTEQALMDMDTHLGICFWGKTGGNGFNGCLDVIPPSGAIWDYGDGGMKPTGVGSANNNIKYQWHQVEILALAATGQVLVAVNGKQVTSYTKAGRPKKGPIGLQAHNGNVHEEYKDIYIEVAPKNHALITLKP